MENLTRQPPAGTAGTPLVSIIVLNYNGARWLERCLKSLQTQTIFNQLEVIVADNDSPDKSDKLAAELMKGWPNGKVVQHGANLGFCEGNNRGALHARGQYLFFLNNDTWLEPSCMEVLVKTVQQRHAQAAAPLILNYDDNTVQSCGGNLDLFGLMSIARYHPEPRDIFVAGGSCYLIERSLFEKVGGFDKVLFMYADEFDLSWRVWVAGGRILFVPDARLHHRGAANVNPAGGAQTVERRTSDSKRFYSNRNCLLLLLKNCQHVLLLLVPLQLLLLSLEAAAFLLLVRRWSFLKRAYLEAVWDCWRLRRHIASERRRLHAFRQRSDWQLFRFFDWRPNRWDEFQNLRRHGLPKVSAQ